MEIICPQCESPNVVQVDVNRYECPYCGKAFSTQEGMMARQNATRKITDAKKNNDKSGRLIMVLTIVFVVLALCGIGGYVFYTMNDKGGYGEDESFEPVDTIACDRVAYEEGYETPIGNKFVRLTGKVNDKYEVVLELEVRGNDLTGRYYYMSSYRKYGDVPTTYITLNGTMDKYPHFRLIGTFYNSNQTEIWEGSLYISGRSILEATCDNGDGNVFHMVATED